MKLENLYLPHSDPKKRIKLPVETIINNGRIYVLAQYNQHLINELKQFQGARYTKEYQCWSFPINERNVTVFESLKQPKKIIWPPIEEHQYESIARPFRHQTRIANFILSRKRCYIAGEMGIGKTLATLLALNRIKSTLQGIIIAPRAALIEWYRQINRFGYAWIYDQFNFINYESLIKYERAFDSYNCVVLDESVKIKNPNAKRSEVVAKLCEVVRRKNGYIICLSGAPIPKNPTDWWNQIEMLYPGYIKAGSPQQLGYQLGRWEKTSAQIESLKKEGIELTAEQKQELIIQDGTSFAKLVEWDQAEILRFNKHIAPIVLSIRKKDVFDLPEKVYEPIDIQPSADLLAAARQLPFMFNRSITVLSKLRQLSDGFMYSKDSEDEESDVLDIPNSVKETKLEELLDYYEVAKRVVIYAAFTASLKKVETLCEKNGWEVQLINAGSRPSIEFLNKFADPDRYQDCMAIVAYPGCVEGLNFSASPVLIYYSNTFLGNDRMQSLERCDRPQKDGSIRSVGTKIIDLFVLPTDRLVWSNVTLKKSINDISMEQIRECLM